MRRRSLPVRLRERCHKLAQRRDAGRTGISPSGFPDRELPGVFDRTAVIAVIAGLAYGGEWLVYGNRTMPRLIVGDMVDDVIWAEVGVAQFVVACSTLFAVHRRAQMLRRPVRTTR